jgi:hypothetical protein
MHIIFKNSVPGSRKAQRVSLTKITWSILFLETLVVYSETLLCFATGSKIHHLCLLNITNICEILCQAGIIFKTWAYFVKMCPFHRRIFIHVWKIKNTFQSRSPDSLLLSRSVSQSVGQPASQSVAREVSQSVGQSDIH